MIVLPHPSKNKNVILVTVEGLCWFSDIADVEIIQLCNVGKSIAQEE